LGVTVAAPMLLVALAAQKIIWAIGITPSEQKENLPLFF
jgi:hypothetical protein